MSLNFLEILAKTSYNWTPCFLTNKYFHLTIIDKENDSMFNHALITSIYLSFVSQMSSQNLKFAINIKLVRNQNNPLTNVNSLTVTWLNLIICFVHESKLNISDPFTMSNYTMSYSYIISNLKY